MSETEQTGSVDDGDELKVLHVSLMRSKGGNSAWEDEDGDLSIFPGKKPETWMPRVFVETENGKDVIGVCYKREAIARTPKPMGPDEAMEWAVEHEPDGFEDFLQGVKSKP